MANDTPEVLGERERRERVPADAGKTPGGGSLGHDQPADVRRDRPIRNTGDDSHGDQEAAKDSDPVMPRDDAALNIRI